jgi:hypothetical protein
LCHQEEESGDLLPTTILTSTIAFDGKAPMPAIVVLDAEEIFVKAENIAMWKDLMETANLARPLLKEVLPVLSLVAQWVQVLAIAVLHLLHPAK